MDQTEHLQQQLGTWAFLRPGWWALHIIGASLLIGFGVWIANMY